jgi:hypothetical protein
VLFDEGDILKVSPAGLSLESFAVTLWITLPIVKFSAKAGRRHVILGPTHQERGIHLLVDETGSRLGSIDDVSGLFIDSGNDLTKYRKGWHLICVVFDKGRVTYHIDGKPTKDAQALNYTQPIGFIGNSGSGSEPFGTMSDLRIYDGVLNPLQIA